VVLENVEVRRCSSCGDEEVVIPNIEGLHKAIAGLLAEKPAKLSPQEVRFLRTYLGYSSVDFARVMGVTAETVSRWERVDQPHSMGETAERFLRYMAVCCCPISDYGLDKLVFRREEKDTGVLQRVRQSAGGAWESATLAPT